MFEKVNPFHPDKVADRIAGAITDLAYDIAGGPDSNPKIATEVLIGHGCGQIIIETSVPEAPLVAGLPGIMKRICPDIKPEFTNVRIVQQDPHLAANQDGHIRCGDNGIFKGMPLTGEQKELARIAREIYAEYPFDGKYILDCNRLIICQSNAPADEIKARYAGSEVNPLGDWTGGTDVDTGATNRKLGSDMADSVTGGGLHGKDLSKADVSVNIYAFLKAQECGFPVELCCAIGDETIDDIPYAQVVAIAKEFIDSIGGFEKFAEWGLY